MTQKWVVGLHIHVGAFENEHEAHMARVEALEIIDSAVAKIRKKFHVGRGGWRPGAGRKPARY